MATNGMTINGLNPLSALTADDKIPVWDTGASEEPTKEITAQNMANSVKSLASLPNTTEMNNAIAQSTAVVDGSASFSSASGITANNVYLKRSGNICVLRTRLEISGTVAGNNATIATIPDGFRPSSTLSVSVYATYANTNGFFTMVINPSGQIITATGSKTFSSYIFFDLVYMIA